MSGFYRINSDAGEVLERRTGGTPLTREWGPDWVEHFGEQYMELREMKKVVKKLEERILAVERKE